MKRLLVLVLAMMSFMTASAQEYTRAAYIEKFWRVAVEEMHKTGIPASITLAQACLESDNGNSYLAVRGNNHFGIKCHDWDGATIRKDDDRRNECFRKYSNPIDSYRDHSAFLQRQRYAFLYDLEPTDYEGWAYGLSEAGYATDPKYPQLLIRIIEENNLSRFDSMSRNSVSENPGEATRTSMFAEDGDVVYGFTLSREQKSDNGIPYIITGADETLRTIADEFNVTASELKKYNDMKVPSDRRLPDGTIIYLSHKKSRAQRGKNEHVVEEGETLWHVSQLYGVKMKSLLKKNRLDSDSRIFPGDRIRLR